jgi:hypothetical protein
MSGVKNLVMADTEGKVVPTNEMLREEATESQSSQEEQSEK